MTENRQYDSGFSLIEVLIVLVLIATVSSAVVLSLRPSTASQSARVTALKFQSDIQGAVDGGLQNARVFSIAWKANSYAIDTNTNSDLELSWIEIPKELTFRTNVSSPYTISRAFVPNPLSVLIAQFCQGLACWSVNFDGVNTEITSPDESRLKI